MPSALGLATLLLTLTRWLQKTTFTRSELARHQGGSCSSGLLPAWVRPTRSLRDTSHYWVSNTLPTNRAAGIRSLESIQMDSRFLDQRMENKICFIPMLSNVFPLTNSFCWNKVVDTLQFAWVAWVCWDAFSCAETKDSQRRSSSDTEVGEMVNTEIRCRGAH